jgi:hypothetical protein
MKEKSKKIIPETPYGKFLSDDLKMAIRKAQQLNNKDMKGGSNGRK